MAGLDFLVLFKTIWYGHSRIKKPKSMWGEGIESNIIFPAVIYLGKQIMKGICRKRERQEINLLLVKDIEKDIEIVTVKARCREIREVDKIIEYNTHSDLLRRRVMILFFFGGVPYALEKGAVCSFVSGSIVESAKWRLLP